MNRALPCQSLGLTRDLTLGLTLGLALLVNPASIRAVETDVAIPVEGATLHGSLLAPDLRPTVACGLIIAGSGPTDRNGNNPLLPGSNDSLKYLARGLQAYGVETLRYDKRMVARSQSSGQEEASLRFEHYVEDAVALFRWLDERCTAPAFLLGHSEGGHIALTAADQLTPAGIVILAGPGTHPAELIAAQLGGQLQGKPLAEAVAALATLRGGEPVPSVPEGLETLLRPSVQPYLISWFRYEPVRQITAIRTPTLLVYGDMDLQVPVSEGKLLAAANPSARLVVIGGMNHVLKAADGGMAEQLASYSDPSLPLAPGLLRELVSFLTGEP